MLAFLLIFASFSTDLRAFVAAREHTLPPGPMASEDLESVRFANRAETMRLFHRDYEARCVATAKELNDATLVTACVSAFRPSHLTSLASEFEKKGK